MFELLAFIRSVAFAVIYGGIEYRYINNREEGWARDGWNFNEKAVFGQYTPYHAFLLLPLFLVVAFSPTLTTWIADGMLIALVEDIAYFGWRAKWVEKGEWTTKVYGSVSVGRRAIPLWWPAFFVLVSVFYLVPF